MLLSAQTHNRGFDLCAMRRVAQVLRFNVLCQTLENATTTRQQVFERQETMRPSTDNIDQHPKRLMCVIVEYNMRWRFCLHKTCSHFASAATRQKDSE